MERIVKIIFITAEIVSLIAIACLSFLENDNCDPWLRGYFIVALSLLAVVCQREQQYIDWYENDDEKDEEYISHQLDMADDYASREY